MNNVIADRIKNVTLTKAQQKIADYFIRNPELVGMCSSMEVATEIGVSDASIIRFSRAIGYDGFTDLKNDIYNNMAMRATDGINSLSMSERFDMNRKKFQDHSSRQDYLKITEYNLKKTMQENSDDRFEAIIDSLLTAKHRYIVGFRGCLPVASQFVWLLRFSLDHVIFVSDEGPGGIGILQDVAPQDTVVFFSVSRYYKSDLRAALLARRRGARVFVITDSLLSPLVADADDYIIAETRQMSFFHSMLSLNMVGEYLVSRVAQQQKDTYREKVEERDRLSEDLRVK